jgi:hypothetical protein
MGRYVPRSGWAEQKLHAKAAAEKQQSIALVNQSFGERKIVVLRSDASDKTAKQSESDDHFRLATMRNLRVPARKGLRPINRQLQK